MQKFLDYDGLKIVLDHIKSTYSSNNSYYESYLKFGGPNLYDSYSPIDASIMPELSANRFDFGNPRGVTIEYSNDGGATWSSYGAHDASKVELISSSYKMPWFVIGKTKSENPANDMLRVTIKTGPDNGINCYTMLNKFCIYCSTNGSQDCYCTIQKALEATPENFIDIATKVPIGGWPGYNVINVPEFRTYRSAAYTQYGRIRFVFGNSGNNSTSCGLSVIKIKAFGGVGWYTPSNMAANGFPYRIADNSNVEFSSPISSPIFSGTTSGTTFYGNLSGNATSSTTADKTVGTLTINGVAYDGSKDISIATESITDDDISDEINRDIEWANT